MLKKKSPPVTLKIAITIPKSLSDRIDRLRAVGESQGYSFEIEDALVRAISVSLTRWEKRLGLGSNAVAVKRPQGE